MVFSLVLTTEAFDSSEGLTRRSLHGPMQKWLCCLKWSPRGVLHRPAAAKASRVLTMPWAFA